MFTRHAMPMPPRDAEMMPMRYAMMPLDAADYFFLPDVDLRYFH